MNSRMAVITFMDDSGNRPDNSLPGYGRPDQGLPGGPVYPSHGLPPGAVQLPVYPFDPTIPDQSLPGAPGVPTQPIAPGGQPPTPTHPIAGQPPRPTQPIAPGGRFVVKWFACQGLILVPDNSLPPTPQPK